MQAQEAVLWAIGPSGGGRSALGNTLMCDGNIEAYKELFAEGAEQQDQTSAQKQTALVEGRGVKVTYIDSSGLTPQSLPPFPLLEGGVDCLLLVVPLGGVFDSSIERLLGSLLRAVSEPPDTLLARAMLVFTHTSQAVCLLCFLLSSCPPPHPCTNHKVARSCSNEEAAAIKHRAITQSLGRLGASEKVAASIPYVCVDNLKVSKQMLDDFWAKYDQIVAVNGSQRLHLSPNKAWCTIC